MIIMKFGGSSLQTAKRVREVAAIVQNRLDRYPILVLSAMGCTTNHLIEAGQNALHQIDISSPFEEFHHNMIAQLGLASDLVDELLFECNSLLKEISFTRNLTEKLQDLLVSFGERLSVRIFSAYLNKLGIVSVPVDGWDAGIRTSSDFSYTETSDMDERIREAFQEKEGVLSVVTGFIGKNLEGNVMTLGRGGSDLTASLIGKALGVQEIQLWKDVNGILTTDPRIVSQAESIARLSFAEATELAYFGATVLHPTSILPAMSKGISVRIKNHTDPEHPGTLILHHTPKRKAGIVAITHKSQQILVHITSTRMLGQSGFLSAIFQIFADLKLSVDVIATSEVSISLTLGKHNHLSLLKERLQQIATVKIEDSKSIVSLIGQTDRSSELLEIIMRTLNNERIDIQMISYGASKINTSLIINDKEVEHCIRLLYQQFFKKGDYS